MNDIKRKAIVIQGGIGADLQTVQDYLPSNYEAYWAYGAIVIEGYDSHGWTLDGYVIPRLASGLIAAEEIEIS